MSRLIAGAAKCEIRIPKGYPAAEGFGNIYDPIHARAVAVGHAPSGSDSRDGNAVAEDAMKPEFLLISLELTSLMKDEAEGLKQQVAEAVSVDDQNIWVCCTHSFSSPHLMPADRLKSDELRALCDEYRSSIRDAAAAAAKKAVEKAVPVTLSVGSTQCDIVANRNIETPDGWWIGTNGPGLTDRTVTTVSFMKADGSPEAVLLHFGMQPSVMDQVTLEDGKKPITPDVSGLACAKLEAQFPGSTAIWLIGAAGDQAPVKKGMVTTYRDGALHSENLGSRGFDICEELSEKLKNAAAVAVNQGRVQRHVPANEEISGADQGSTVRTAYRTLTLPGKKMLKDLHDLKPVHAWNYEPAGDGETLLSAVRIGGLRLMGVEPELNCSTAKDIAAEAGTAPDAPVLICTMVNGAAKYMADEASYDRFCYEAMNSPWAKGCAEKLAGACTDLLKTV